MTRRIYYVGKFITPSDYKKRIQWLLNHFHISTLGEEERTLETWYQRELNNILELFPKNSSQARTNLKKICAELQDDDVADITPKLALIRDRINPLLVNTDEKILEANPQNS